ATPARTSAIMSAMASEPREPDPPDPGGTPLLATRELLSLAKQGEARAVAQLMERYLPRLQRWAAGRLPMHARSLLDTADLVQDTLLRVLEGLERIEVRGPGGFQAYVRQAVLNRILDEVRWAGRRPGPDGVPETLHDRLPSPLENAIGAEVLERYERGLAQLDEEDRELLHLRIELDFDYEEIAGMTGRPTRDAARMAVQRALTRLAGAMGHER
ncbi:MAG: sigma-70 family RNA polymerase sigma factor, partial [Candidatus Eisenbacteria bacterium]